MPAQRLAWQTPTIEPPPLPGVSTGMATPLQLTLLGVIAAANAAWLVSIVVLTDPDVVTNRLWLLAALTLAIFPLATLVIYALRSPRVSGAAVRTCFPDALREGLLAASFVTANALLRLTGLWTPWAALVLLSLAAIVDLLALSRRWSPPLDLR